MKSLVPALDKLFSFFVFIVILLLAFYMAIRIAAGGYLLFENVLSGVFMLEVEQGEAAQSALRSIAEVVILIKAYRILVSYLKTHHITVEYIVEISIIAPAIELIFASHAYDVPTKIILGVFGLVNLFLYLQYFAPEHDEELHRSVKKSKNL